MKNYEFWFCTGSQDLYGDECLAHVAAHSKEIVEKLNESGKLPFKLVWKPTLITNELIRKTFNEANNDENCAGVITWMHTFSPAKSWILGLQEYRKPLCHFHTQYNEEIPYETIDMDFMNENQTAHGGREYGHIVTRMGIERKVIAGHWKDEAVVEKLASWMYMAVGVIESSHVRVARFADNMRNVAVTEGDKVEAQIKFGWEIDAWPVNVLVEYVDSIPDSETEALTEEYYRTYKIVEEGRDPKEFREHVKVQAQIELGIEKFCKENNLEMPEINLLRGYPDVCENSAFISDIIANRIVPVDRYQIQLRNLPDVNEWQYIQTQEEAQEFMKLFAGFHDSNLVKLTYDDPPKENYGTEILSATLYVDEEGVFWADNYMEKPDITYDGSIIRALSLKWKKVEDVEDDGKFVVPYTNK